MPALMVMRPPATAHMRCAPHEGGGWPSRSAVRDTVLPRVLVLLVVVWTGLGGHPPRFERRWHQRCDRRCVHIGRAADRARRLDDRHVLHWLRAIGRGFL